MTSQGKQTLVVICSVLIAFAVNGVLEITTEMPLIVRWVLAILASIIFTTTIGRTLLRGPRSRSRSGDGRISRDQTDGTTQ